MASILREPTSDPVVLEPACSEIPPEEVVSSTDMVPWAAYANATSHEVAGLREHYHLHPAVAEELSKANLTNMSALGSDCMPVMPLNGAHQSVPDLGIRSRRPALAWQDEDVIPEVQLSFNSDPPREESLAVTDGQPWIVVHVCGAGSVLVGDELLLKHGDVWTCFGNVMLARQGQQIMLCRHAAFSQMMNCQSASNGCDIAINDCRCSQEEWCMPVAHEQACMDALAGFLQFVLTATSQVLVQFGVFSCSKSGPSSSLPPWQTPCLQTNAWVTQSGTKMWDLVLNGKNIMESSPVECGARPIGANNINSTASILPSAVGTAKALQLADVQDIHAQVVPMVQLPSTSGLQTARVYGNETAWWMAPAVEIPLYQHVPTLVVESSDEAAPTLLALEDGEPALEDGEPDTESEMIKEGDSKSATRVTPAARGNGKVAFQPECEGFESLQSHAMHRTQGRPVSRRSERAPQDGERPVSRRSAGTKAPLYRSAAPWSWEEADPDAASEIQMEACVLDMANFQAECRTSEAARLPRNSKPRSIPTKPSSKNALTRPRRQQSRSEKTRQSPCMSFRMDAGDAHGAVQRESSLSRNYDALDGDMCRLRDEMSSTRTSMDRESSLARSYDALDAFKVPAQLPPVKGTPSKSAASRFSSRHRATMAAASVMAWELGNRDDDQIHTCKRSASTADISPDLRQTSPVDMQSTASDQIAFCKRSASASGLASPDLKRPSSGKINAGKINAAVSPASVRAWELGKRDMDQMHACKRSTSVSSLSPDLKHPPRGKMQSFLSPTSAAALDLNDAMWQDVSKGSKTTTSNSPSLMAWELGSAKRQSGPKLRPFAISEAKLPPLPSQRKSLDAAGWSVPVATSMQII